MTTNMATPTNIPIVRYTVAANYVEEDDDIWSSFAAYQERTTTERRMNLAWAQMNYDWVKKFKKEPKNYKTLADHFNGTNE